MQNAVRKVGADHHMGSWTGYIMRVQRANEPRNLEFMARFYLRRSRLSAHLQSPATLVLAHCISECLFLGVFPIRGAFPSASLAFGGGQGRTVTTTVEVLVTRPFTSTHTATLQHGSGNQ